MASCGEALSASSQSPLLHELRSTIFKQYTFGGLGMQQ
jgi:hypothetical protein